jgi:hypothetical protein
VADTCKVLIGFIKWGTEVVPLLPKNWVEIGAHYDSHKKIYYAKCANKKEDNYVYR